MTAQPTIIRVDSSRIRARWIAKADPSIDGLWLTVDRWSAHAFPSKAAATRFARTFLSGQQITYFDHVDLGAVAARLGAELEQAGPALLAAADDVLDAQAGR